MVRHNSTNGADYLLYIHRFDERFSEAGPLVFFPVFGRAKTRDCNAGNSQCRQLTHQIATIPIRQRDIGKQKVAGSSGGPRFSNVRGFLNVEPFPAQDPCECAQGIGVIFDQKQSARPNVLVRFRWS